MRIGEFNRYISTLESFTFEVLLVVNIDDAYNLMTTSNGNLFDFLDVVVVMANGQIQQIGSPTDIYNEPENAFVADFIGESNIVDGVMLQDYKVRFSGHTFECVDAGFDKNQKVDVVVRPEDVDVVPVDKGMLQGTVTSVTFKGVHWEIIVDIGGFKWMIQTTDFVAEGEHIGLYIEPEAIHIMHKSEFSGMFGDYSSFSDELELLSDPTEPGEEEDEEE